MGENQEIRQSYERIRRNIEPAIFVDKNIVPSVNCAYVHMEYCRGYIFIYYTSARDVEKSFVILKADDAIDVTDEFYAFGRSVDTLMVGITVGHCSDEASGKVYMMSASMDYYGVMYVIAVDIASKSVLMDYILYPEPFFQGSFMFTLDSSPNIHIFGGFEYTEDEELTTLYGQRTGVIARISMETAECFFRRWELSHEEELPTLIFSSIAKSVDRDTVYVYGGVTKHVEHTPSESTFNHKLYFFGKETGYVWKTVESSPSHSPCERGSASIIIHGNDMYMFGGTNYIEVFDDLWRYNLTSGRWSKIDTKFSIPRWGHTALVFEPGTFSIFYGLTSPPARTDKHYASVGQTIDIKPRTLVASALRYVEDHY